MDPLSAAASIIAVVGAAATVAKELEKLRRTLRDAPDAVCSLINEVSDFELVLSACEAAVEDLAQGDDNNRLRTPLLAAGNVLDKAGRHLAELGQLVGSCVKPVAGDNGGVQQMRVAKLRWLKVSGAAKKLQGKLHDSKQEILMILEANSMSAVSEMRLTVEGFSVGTHQFQTKASDKLDDILEELKHQAARMEQLTAINRGLMARLRTTDTRPIDEEMAVSDPGSPNPPAYEPVEQRAESIAVLASCYRKTCRPWCSCRCHARQSIRSPSNKMIKSFVGSLFVGYSGIPGITPTCNEARCRKRSTSRVILSYQFPEWFWTRALFASFTTNTLPGPELLLRVQSVIPFASQTYQHCLNGEVLELKSKFDNGTASPFDVDPEGLSLLHNALKFKLYDMCRLLVSYGADLYQEDHSGLSAYHYAWDAILLDAESQSTKQDVLALFPQEEGGLDERQFSRIHKCVLGLIGADLSAELSISTSVINEVDNVGRTALYWAARRGDLRSVSLLLEFDADPNKAGPRRLSSAAAVDRPLHAAASAGDLAIVRSLLGNPSVDVNQPGDSNMTALFYAAAHNDGNGCVQMLLDAGAHPDPRDTDDRTPFLVATQNGMLKNAAALLASGADMGATCEGGWTALVSCVFWNMHDPLMWLLGCGAAYDTVTDEGETLLHIAALYGDQKMMEVLCESGIYGLDADAKTGAGQTAHDIADSREELDKEWRESFARLMLAATRHEVYEKPVGGWDTGSSKGEMELLADKVAVHVAEIRLEDSDSDGEDVFHDAIDTLVTV